MIPRRVAYRIWAHVLGGQARHLRSLATGRNADPRRGRTASPAAAAGRLDRADRAAAAADVLASWIGGGGPPGGDLDPAVVGLASAWLLGRTEAMAEIEDRIGPRGPAVDSADTIGIIRWILES